MSLILTSNTVLTANQFRHLACSWNGTTLSLYVDGVLDKSTPQTLTPLPNTSPLYIGQFGGNVDRLLGVIDEVRIYNRALTQAEIQQDMTGLTVTKSGTGTGTVTSSPAGINCGATCSASFIVPGTSVTLTPTAAAGSIFIGWSGAADCSDGIVTMTGNVACTATFNVANTGPLPPTANAAETSSAGDNNGYETTPNNAYVLDGLFAVDTSSGTNTSTSCADAGKDKHRFYNYNFSIPTGVTTIKGITVQLNAKVNSTSGTPKICIQLSWDGGATWTAAKQMVTTLTTSVAPYTLGTATDTWGRTWSVNDFTNANFRLRVIDISSVTTSTFSLDQLAVQINY